MKLDWTIISHYITQSFSSWMFGRICIMSLGLKGLRLVHTYDTNISTSVKQSTRKVCVNRDDASISASIRKKRNFLVLLVLALLCRMCELGCYKHKHKRKESTFLLVDKQTNKCIQSNWGETLYLYMSLCLCFISHSCECPCAYACTYVCVIRVTQPFHQSAKYGKCGVWKMRSMENVEYGKCGVWKMRSIRCLQYQNREPTFWLNVQLPLTNKGPGIVLGTVSSWFSISMVVQVACQVHCLSKTSSRPT